MSNARQKKAKQASSVRIIGGQFRSRKILFFEEDGLRPTHSRIRETVFNWLQNDIANKTCLDAFAGSGAMGLEALSRGAKHVTFCDLSRSVIETIKQNAATLKIDHADFIQADFTLENTIKNKKFDIVFLDPPFQKNLLLKACAHLISHELLNKDALIYLEFKKNSIDLSELPKNWIIKKQGETSTITYLLCGSDNHSH